MPLFGRQASVPSRRDLFLISSHGLAFLGIEKSQKRTHQLQPLRRGFLPSERFWITMINPCYVRVNQRLFSLLSNVPAFGLNAPC